ncbi:MAG: response regulator [Kiritimatiellia bacterium]
MTNDLPEPKFLSVPDAAKICGVSRNTVFMWVRQAKLYAYKTPGNTNLIRPSDLVKFMTSAGMFVPASLSEMAAQDDKVVNASGSSLHAKKTTAPAKSLGRVLVVDDDAMVRTLTMRMLKEVAEVFLAETGFEALHLLTQHNDIDVILLDLRMPGQHGIDTLKDIRKLSPHSAVIVVSGFADDLPKALLENGMIDQFLQKPVESDVLIRAVTDALRLHSKR